MTDEMDTAYECEIQRRTHRGREQFRYQVHLRRSWPGTELLPTGRWTRSREKAERKGRRVMAKKERKLLERPVTVGILG